MTNQTAANNLAKPTVLCIDDELDNLDALERLLRSRFHVLKANSALHALSILEHQPNVAVIITDQKMPQMTGVELLSKVQSTHPDSVRILLTGYTDIASIIDAVNNGQIYRYITKPWDPTDLVNTVATASERYGMALELKAKNEALTKALSELQTLDQAKTQFMLLINHELKTPLTAILSFLELLMETNLDEEQSLCAKRIQRNTERLKTLVDDVMLVIQSETKTLRLKTQVIECQNLNLSLSEEVQKILSQKNQKLELKFENLKLLADPGYLLQVLQRLVHNAAKFGDPDSTIRINAKSFSPHKVRISVYNQGKKIPEAVVDKIMKPFFIDEAVMNHSVGLGLGLTICQAILKTHSSTISVENKDLGVEVSFELPGVST